MALNDVVGRDEFIELATGVKDNMRFAKEGAGGYGTWLWLLSDEAKNLVRVEKADEILICALKHYRRVQYNKEKTDYYTPGINSLLESYAQKDENKFRTAVCDYVHCLLAE